MAFANDSKKDILQFIAAAYSDIVNFFIKEYEHNPIPKKNLLKGEVDKALEVCPWASFSMRQMAAREALDMLRARNEELTGTEKRAKAAEKALKKAIKKGHRTNKLKNLAYKWRSRVKPKATPKHSGRRMQWSAQVCEIQMAKTATGFDYWLHISCVGSGIILDIPIKATKHFRRMMRRGGKLLKSFVINPKNLTLQLVFEFQVPKRKFGTHTGSDLGIHKGNTLGNGKMFGLETWKYLERILRCKPRSKGRLRARRAYDHYLDREFKKFGDYIDSKNIALVVTEILTNIGYKTKERRRLFKDMRRFVAVWKPGSCADKLQRTLEDRRSALRRVLAYDNSITCSECRHRDKKNRTGQTFLCGGCGYSCDADINAARNAEFRFFSGPYAAGFKDQRRWGNLASGQSRKYRRPAGSRKGSGPLAGRDGAGQPVLST